MPLKDIIALLILLVAYPTATAVAMLSRSVRDFCFFMFVICIPITDRMDVNFFSREWYKGTTTGLEVSLLDMLALGILTSLILRPIRNTRRIYWPVALLPMLCYLGYGMLSVLFSEPKLFGFFELTKLVRGLIIFLTAAFYIRSERELRVLVTGLATIVCLEGLYAIKTRYIDGVYRIEATFPHANSLSMFMCMLAPVLYTTSVSKLPSWMRSLALAGCGLAAAGVILTVSRTGVATVCVVMLLSIIMCFSFTLNWRNLLITGGILCGMTVGIVHAWPTLMERFGSASMADEYGKNNAMNRGSYLRLAGMIHADHYFGVGLNNWSYYVTGIYGPRFGLPYTAYLGTDTPPDEEVHSGMVDPNGTPLDGAQAAPAHNLGALTLGELGTPGLIIFAIVWIRWLQVGSTFLLRRTANPLRRVGIGIFFGTCAVFFQSLTEWEFRQTALFFMFNLLVGSAAALHRIKKLELRSARIQRARDREALLSGRQPGPAGA